MDTIETLGAATRYLRFPLESDHRAPLRNGSSCPHCYGKKTQKWGRFSGRQRFRCRACGRTFSTFTNTALHHLKRVELWRRFLWCHDGRLTVRASAAVLGVDKNTALRWRHRLLDQWREERRPRLKGRLVVGHFSVPTSAKGSRSLTRPARRRGEDWWLPGLQTDPVTVLVAYESPTALLMECSGPGRLRSIDYDRKLLPRTRDVTEVVGCTGPCGELAAFSSRIGAAYTQQRRSFFPYEVFVIRRELRAWLRPFRGVATRNLDNYLEWFRRRGGPHGPPEPFPTTPAYRAL